MPTQLTYRGRFAPSPSGALHFGSLITAVASYLQAKQQQGEWLLRIDDIDPPREKAGATKDIIKTLEAFGFEWDGEVLYQSNNQQRYQDAVDQLIEQKHAYPCSCSRAQIIQKTQQTTANLIYPGFCRNGPVSKADQHSIRLRSENTVVRFGDCIQGKQSFDLEKTHGDFSLQRRDHYFSYHLASAVDDAEQGITEVIRGADLLESTPCQLHVQHLLELPSPRYCHIPIIVNNLGQKFSKQTNADPIMSSHGPVVLLYEALKFLGQKPPVDLKKLQQDELWSWAKIHWQLKFIPKNTQQENTSSEII